MVPGAFLCLAHRDGALALKGRAGQSHPGGLWGRAQRDTLSILSWTPSLPGLKIRAAGPGPPAEGLVPGRTRQKGQPLSKCVS